MKKRLLVIGMLLLTLLVGCNVPPQTETENDKQHGTTTAEENVEKDESIESENESETVTSPQKILAEAFANTGSYKAKRTLKTWVYVYNRESSAFDEDSLLDVEVLYDVTTQSSYEKGTWTNAVIDTWTGTTTTRNIEAYHVIEGNEKIMYDVIFNGQDWCKAPYYSNPNDITIYYDNHFECTLKEENDSAYVIESYIYYGTLLDELLITGIDPSKEILVTYTVNKENQTIQNIQWLVDASSDINEHTVEMNMEIMSEDGITVTVPEYIRTNSFDAGI